MNKEEILDKHIKIMIEKADNFAELEEMKKLPEYAITLDAMEEYAQQQVKNNGVLPIVSPSVSPQGRELLIDFKTWEIENDIKNLLPEQLVDFYLDESINGG